MYSFHGSETKPALLRTLSAHSGLIKLATKESICEPHSIKKPMAAISARDFKTSKTISVFVLKSKY